MPAVTAVVFTILLGGDDVGDGAGGPTTVVVDLLCTDTASPPRQSRLMNGAFLLQRRTETTHVDRTILILTPDHHPQLCASPQQRECSIVDEMLLLSFPSVAASLQWLPPCISTRPILLHLQAPKLSVLCSADRRLGICLLLQMDKRKRQTASGDVVHRRARAPQSTRRSASSRAWTSRIETVPTHNTSVNSFSQPFQPRTHLQYHWMKGNEPAACESSRPRLPLPLPFPLAPPFLSCIMNCITNADTSMTCTPISTYNDGDAAWMLTSTAIVYMMTPGVGFFYGGMVGSKNLLNTIFMSIICMGMVTFQWNLIDYSWAFSATENQVWGSFDWAALRFDPSYPSNCGTATSLADVTACFNAGTYSLSIHSAFQCAFAVITPAPISGAIIGRMKFIPYCLFLWTCICYDPLACWVWNYNGWLHNLGSLDFAGGTVVHISSATSGLTACIILGKRVDWQRGHTHKPANIPFIVLGTSLLWVGWAGFNGGSALAANALAGTALINTNGSAASAMMTWVLIDALRGRVSVAGACSGIVVGLVAITPACGFVHPGYALLIGIIGTCVVYPSQILWKRWMKVDDTLDVFTCHGMGGITGAIVTGLFAESHWNAALVDGKPMECAFFNNGKQLGLQLAAVVVTLAWSSFCTACILGILHFVFGRLRPSKDEEILGLDQAAHGESWEVASQVEGLLAVIQHKDHQVNGEKHDMHHGRLQLQYLPDEAGMKPVSVEMALHSPQSPPSTANGHLMGDLERASSATESEVSHLDSTRAETDY